ncbi:hypothetical protein OCGS_0852 [Oceaniovalibus guishaninsula JLT2003]|uniref:NADH dehydrogenase subunit E n=1 Tax=Oceaniovalibus guishaninsula JLT2003 TaxID=1231392 RepID=K2HFC0_9RHOB|nr:DUF5333 domain-containing protein [Oceaniovalibus guishaninsula]EKE45157.1 hypothetical protein OCGS_0852 [Oceaniovalibus guishaninsula JLT2003]
MRLRFLLPLILMASSGSVAAQGALERDPIVRAGFYAIGLADEVRRNCPQISPRLVRAYSYLKSLESYARNAGYSEAEIQALTKNKDAKNALRAEIRADLASRGATPGNASGYCAVGRQEIARGTEAGKLLQEN